MSKSKGVTIYEKEKGKGYYGDFRRLGGKLEALIAKGERRATTDRDEAEILKGQRIEELKKSPKSTHEQEATLGAFAEYHLKQKKDNNEATDWTLGGVERSLEHAVEFFGASKPLTAIHPKDVMAWASWLGKTYKGRRGNKTLGGGAVRHCLNALANLYVRAIMDEKVPPGYNPVAMWGHNRPKGKKTEAHSLEIHQAALLLEAAKLYKPERSDVAIPDLHALIATHLLTGGRPAEIRGLAIDDVSFANKTVTFRPNEHRRLKTDTSKRTVPLWPQLEEILTAYLEGPNAPKGKLLFPSSHRRVRGRKEEEMIGDIRKALDTVAVEAGWKAGDIRPYAFRHSYCAARLQTLDRGAPVAEYTVAREMGHGGTVLIKTVYGHLGNVRARSEVVEYRPSILKQINDEKTRRDFEDRFEKVARHLKLVA